MFAVNNLIVMKERKNISASGELISQAHVEHVAVQLRCCSLVDTFIITFISITQNRQHTSAHTQNLITADYKLVLTELWVVFSINLHSCVIQPLGLTIVGLLVGGLTVAVRLLTC